MGRFLASASLFTDMRVIDHYVINQSTELANNLTYMRGGQTVGCQLAFPNNFTVRVVRLCADLGY